MQYANPSIGSIWLHKRRGSSGYKIVANDARMQISSEPEIEVQLQSIDWTVYQDVNSLRVFIRPTSEFLDGRFEQVSTR